VGLNLSQPVISGLFIGKSLPCGGTVYTSRNTGKVHRIQPFGRGFFHVRDGVLDTRVRTRRQIILDIEASENP
jgi:hypothetical protein